MRSLVITLHETSGLFGVSLAITDAKTGAKSTVPLSEGLQISRAKALQLSQEVCGLLTLLNPSTIAIFSDQTGQEAQHFESPSK